MCREHIRLSIGMDTVPSFSGSSPKAALLDGEAERISQFIIQRKIDRVYADWPEVCVARIEVYQPTLVGEFGLLDDANELRALRLHRYSYGLKIDVVRYLSQEYSGVEDRILLV